MHFHIENLATGERFDQRQEIYSDNGSKLTAVFHYNEMRLSKDDVARRRKSMVSSFDVYQELMPVFSKMVSPPIGMTPCEKSEALSDELGVEVYVKYPMYYVTGSHKTYHLIPAANYTLQLRGDKPITFANYSCGNAGDAASYVANMLGKKVKIFLLPEADDGRVAPMAMRGSEVYKVEWDKRVQGDPSYHMFKKAVERSAVPLACAGKDNWAAVEGGKVVFFEAMEQAGYVDFDHIFMQVGGGLFANAGVNAYRDAKALGWINKIPAMHMVQTEQCYPLKQAYDKLISDDGIIKPTDVRKKLKERAIEAKWSAAEPSSIAYGILDVETYEYIELLEAMVATGGKPLTASEALLKKAWVMGNKLTGHFACPTGTSGLAGLIKAIDDGIVKHGERTMVYFTGIGYKQLSSTAEFAKNVKTINPVEDENVALG